MNGKYEGKIWKIREKWNWLIKNRKFENVLESINNFIGDRSERGT